MGHLRGDQEFGLTLDHGCLTHMIQLPVFSGTIIKFICF